MIGKSLMQHNCLKKNYRNLHMKDVTDSDYMHAKRVCKDYKIKKLRSIS